LILTQITYDTEITVGKSIFQYPNVNKNIVLIGNGINMEEFHYSEKKHQVYKILFVGRLDEFKGVDILIQAIASIQNQTNRAFEVHLVGYGYEEEQYKKLVLQL
jgi:glycosyltransferase involved in cell wall biosynthesis